MKVAFCSFRLGGRDGVAVEVAKWQRAFARLGWTVYGVAGSGVAEHIVPGLALDAADGPPPDELAEALHQADLVVVDNLCSIPLNPAASASVAQALAGRPAVLRHHDLVWQHERWERAGWEIPTDPAWQHVVINELSRRQMAQRGLEAITAYNTFEVGPEGNRAGTRAAMNVGEDEVLLLHPTRAIERKGVRAALALAEVVGGTYWLTGDAEQGYGPELDSLLSQFRGRVIRDPADHMADAYAACDAVLFPSVWEGFGNPPIEAAIHRRAAAVGAYPVAAELKERFGFRWLRSDDPKPLQQFLAHPDQDMLTHNREIATANFSAAALGDTLGEILGAWGW